MHLGDSDVAFVLGRGGVTKQKLARVSGAQLEVDNDGRLEIRGDEISRKRAKNYVELVLAQRVGPVYIDFEKKTDDLSIVDVPTDCVGYVTGRNGVVLRALEEEWGTLMFFAKGKSKADRERHPDTERLAIYGTLRRRCGAELKVMSAVEHKSPGFFLDSKGRPRNDILDRYDDGKFGITTMEIAEHEIGYALGKQGTTRKKLARAGGCILEYVGCTAFIAGTRDDRDRGRDYLEWLLEQQKGAVFVDTDRRDDVTVLEVPSSVVGYLTGYKGASLREVEDRTDTFIFSNGDRRDSINSTDPDREEKLLIFGASRDARKRAERILRERMQMKLEEDRRTGGYRRRGRSRSRSRSRSRDQKRYRRSRSRSNSRGRRSYSRSPSRSRSRSPSRGRR